MRLTFEMVDWVNHITLPNMNKTHPIHRRSEYNKKAEKEKAPPSVSLSLSAYLQAGKSVSYLQTLTGNTIGSLDSSVVGLTLELCYQLTSVSRLPIADFLSPANAVCIRIF